MVWIYTDIKHIGHYVELPNTKIFKKYLIRITLSVQISSKLFDQKYVNLMNFRFYRISLYWVRWCACHEGVLMSDEDENIMNVGCYSQPASCCLPQHLTAILWLISLGWSSWLQGSSSHSRSMFFFISKIQVDHPHDRNQK